MTNGNTRVVTLLNVAEVIGKVLKSRIVLPVDVSGSCLSEWAGTLSCRDIGIRVGRDNWHGYECKMNNE